MDAHQMPVANPVHLLTCPVGRVAIIVVLAFSFSSIAPGDQPIGNSKRKPVAKWPQARALMSQLEPLAEQQYTGEWTNQTLQLLDLLGQTELGDASVEAIFSQLRQKLAELDELIAHLSTSPGYSSVDRAIWVGQLRRIRYRIHRRLSIWIPVHDLAKSNFTTLASVEEQEGPIRLASSGRILFGNISPNWQQYLLTDEIDTAFGSLNPDSETQRDVARRVLARMYSPVLSQEQQDFIQTNIDEQVDEYLRVKASSNLDLAALLLYIEANELNNSGIAQHRLNDQYQNLRWSQNESLQQIGSLIDTHYRNANFRLTVSEAFMNRLLPKMPATKEPFADNILGAYVHGQNYVSSELHIGLIPDAQRIHLRLETTGEVNSNTLAHKSGVTMENEGVSRFQVFKRLAFDREGVFSDRPVAFSENSQRLVGLRSKLDAIPILGWMAKRVAHQQIAAKAPQTRQYMKHKLESEVKDRMQREVDDQLTQIRGYLYQNLLQPLIAMELEPTPLQMNTTSEHVVMRYRLAGRDQMAAHTSRPRELDSSLMSIQMHQSVVNNLLMRCEIAGRKFTAVELQEHLKQVFRLQDKESVRDMDADAQFEFFNYDPIRVDFEQDLIRITLNLRSLQLEGGKKWKKLKVTVAYRPTVSGTRIKLVQEEKVRVQGNRLRLVDQVPVCAIFNTIFNEDYEMNTLPKQLREQLQSPEMAIAQLVSGDGWIGVSLVDQVAHRPIARPGRKAVNKLLENVRR